MSSLPRIFRATSRRSSLLLVLVYWVTISLAYGQESPQVRLEPVSQEVIFQEVTLTGTINTLEAANLASSVSGLVESLDVTIGDRVEPGDTLLRLDDDLVQFERATAEASVNEAAARLAEAERLLREARSVGAGRNIAATEVSARESEVRVAGAVLAQREAQRSRLDELLTQHQVKAPFAGVISQRSVDRGEWVTPGDALVRLVDTEHLRADFQIPQGYLALLNDQASLHLGADDEWLETAIRTRVPVSDPQSRTFLLRAEVPERTSFYPGAAVDGLLRVTDGEKGLTVARDALNRHPDGRVTVWVAQPEENGDGYRVTEKRIRLGVNFTDRVEVVDGLSGDEQIVTRGNEALTEGIRVRTTDAAETP